MFFFLFVFYIYIDIVRVIEREREREREREDNLTKEEKIEKERGRERETFDVTSCSRERKHSVKDVEAIRHPNVRNNLDHFISSHLLFSSFMKERIILF